MVASGEETAASLGLDGGPGSASIGIRPGVRVSRWPALYLTARVGQVWQLWRMHRAGTPAWEGPAVLWPAPLARAFAIIRSETDIRDARIAAEVTRG